MTENLIIFGGGKIGQMIAAFLADCGDYNVTVGDYSDESLKKFSDLDVTCKKVDVSNKSELADILKGQKYVINACPYMFTPFIAKATKEAEAHYFDLTEDVANTKIVKELAKDAKSTFMPQCGLAPGFVSISANYLADKFDEIEELRMRVGALPKYPTNALKYNLTWSTDGLINEYCQLCDALVNGETIKLPPLEGLERFAIEGIDYEAFNTSGGLGSLCDTLKGKAKNLNYKSIRYPGHRDIMRFLLNDLKLKDQQDLLKELFDNAIPATTQDVVLVFNTALGTKDGRYVQEIYTTRVYAEDLLGQERSAIQISTAAGICAVVDLVREQKLPQSGFVRQEEISLNDFLANRFGQYYSKGESV
jgi:saccharopine dehydrogenase-like NADP-dependent oxidoreductase